MKRLVFLGLGAALALAGCGGGGGSLDATRTRVKRIDNALGSRAQFDPMAMLSSGIRGTMADSLGGFLGSNGLPGTGFGTEGYTRARAAGKTRASASGFYFDGYLKLWAQKSETSTDTTTETRYDFFVDEAKTQPGGFVSSVQPKWNWEGYVGPPIEVTPDSSPNIPPIWQPGYPIVYKTTYDFTAGTLKGSHGLSENITNADYSFDSKYENVYADGWKDAGNNHYDSNSSTWFSRIETGDGKFAEAAGSFRGVIGGSRIESSEGDKADYQFSSNGSGHGTISGKDPGMPVTVSWDASGNVLVRYADGTTESFQRGGFGGVGDIGPGGTTGYPMPIEGDGGIGDTPMPVEPDGGIGGPAHSK
jgi:hypothetical protein